eukprot:34469_4
MGQDDIHIHARRDDTNQIKPENRLLETHSLSLTASESESINSQSASASPSASASASPSGSLS